MDISFCASYGAGGFSLAPNLKILSVVAPWDSAMRLLYHHRYRENSPDNVILQLRQLFLEGKASPFDIDGMGRNLIHVS